MDTQAIALTIRLASTTTLLLMMIAVPLSGWLAFSRSRFRPLVASLTALPFVLPPTVIGYYLLIAFGTNMPLGRALARFFGHPLTFTFDALVIGSVLYSLPFAVQPLLSGFRAIDPTVLESAAVLGAKPMRVFREIVMPLSRPAMLTSAVLAFAQTVGAFGVILMLGGNIAGRTQTLSVELYNQSQAGNHTAANPTALLLLAVSLCALIVIYTNKTKCDGLI